ncbi:MAG: hypothetical protein A2787_00805 [Omnitrophica WOR_2 bacterium RIFCSPHIGHO2_01_FULL_48_9]|nr:MAG: hypothetical protein A2787_00805 [Omnitrophica WOR_2 bacterium RIFCSPHIGHO2_01_FULL_48_9]
MLKKSSFFTICLAGAILFGFSADSFAQTNVSGPITQNTIWSLTASPYIVVGDITVNFGVTLTIQPGVEVKFNGNYELTVAQGGTLNAVGTSTQMIRFTSNQTTPAPGDWQYIRLLSSTSVVRYASIEYATFGLYVPYYSPVIENNLIQNNVIGVNLLDSPSTIRNNTIINNGNGIHSTGAPTINNNSIYNNSGYNLYASVFSSTSVVHAENNWWGTTDIQIIMAKIFDYQDDERAPSVYFTPFLDGPNGNPIGQEYIQGLIAGNNHWSTSHGPYVVIGDIRSLPGAVLTIDPGVQVKFNGNYKLDMHWQSTLDAQGTASQMITFTSNRAAPARGDWQFIRLTSTSIVKYARIEYADWGLNVDGVSPVIENSSIQNNNLGIRIYYSSSGLIRNNAIINNAYGIYIQLRMVFAPAPTINHNSIYGNNQFNIYADNGGFNLGPIGSIIDARANWWGTTDVNAIMASIFDKNDDNFSPYVDFMPYLEYQGENLILVSIINVFTQPQFFNPVVAETSHVNYTISHDSDVTIKIYNFQNNQLVRTLISSQPRLAGPNSEAWDGRSDQGQILSNAIYYFTITVRSSNPSRRGNYLFRDIPGTLQFNSGSISANNFNPYKGEAVNISYSLSVSGWVTLKVGPNNNSLYPTKVLVNNQPRKATGNGEVWDGRDDSGNMVNADSYLVYGWAVRSLPINSFVIQNAAPNIDFITTNPYAIYPAHGEVSEIKYRISQNGRVQIVIKDPANNTVRTLQNYTQTPAGEHTIVWDGKDNAGKTVAAVGNYKAEVTVTDPTGFVSRTRSGNVTVFK